AELDGRPIGSALEDAAADDSGVPAAHQPELINLATLECRKIRAAEDQAIPLGENGVTGGVRSRLGSGKAYELGRGRGKQRYQAHGMLYTAPLIRNRVAQPVSLFLEHDDFGVKRFDLAVALGKASHGSGKIRLGFAASLLHCCQGADLLI